MWKKKTNLRANCIITIVLAAMVASSCSAAEPRLKDKILDYCESNGEITLSAVISFDWDIAFFDYQSYMQGEEIKEKYGLGGEFETLQTDHSYRIAFYNDGELVRDEILDWAYIEFERRVETIEPDTLFTAEWTSRPYNDRVLSLRLANDEEL